MGRIFHTTLATPSCPAQLKPVTHPANNHLDLAIVAHLRSTHNVTNTTKTRGSHTSLQGQQQEVCKRVPHPPRVKEVDPEAAGEEEGFALKDDSLLSDLQGSIPGIDEAMSFAEVMKIVNTMDYDVVVFDTAPTGHTLRLLQLPSMLDKALGKFAGLKGSMGPLFGQVADMLGV